MIFLTITDEQKMYKWLVFGLLIVVLIMIIIPLIYSIMNKHLSKSRRIKIMSIIAVFSALSIGLYFLKFNLPFIFPEFLEIQFSALPGIIIGLLLGPIEGITVILIKTILKVPFSSTLGVGELADLVIGVTTVLITSLLYRKVHTKKGGIISLVSGGVAWVIMATLANLIILVPFYVALFFDGNLNAFIGMCEIIPGINETNYMSRYLFSAIVPFNTLLSLLTMIITFIVYKRISIVFNNVSEEN